MTLSSTHKTRVLTALVLFPLLIAAIIWRGWLEFGVIVFVAGVGLWEFYSLLWLEKPRIFLRICGVFLGVLLLFVGKMQNTTLILASISAAFWITNIYFLQDVSRAGGKEQGRNPYSDFIVLIAGLLYVPFALHFLFAFHRLEVIFILLAVQASDIGAYYIGCSTGGPKIWPAISPKKTWAGSLGGLSLCVLISLIIGGVDEYFLAEAQAGRPWWLWASVGVALNVASQLGDFFESALKRCTGVKDSGNFLPGHGGVLDRIDSLLFAIVVYAGLDSIFNFFPTF